MTLPIDSVATARPPSSCTTVRLKVSPGFGVLVEAPSGKGADARRIREEAGASEVEAWDEGGEHAH